MPHRRLPRPFYLQPTLDVARALLGLYLVRRNRSTTVSGKIVEVEAYLGSIDPASHAYRGPTPRNEVMFRLGGCLYVYFTYGMHFCSNVVTGEKGVGHAVLLRAVEPVDGILLMARRRGLTPAEMDRLCSGPARLCQAFGITGKQNGTDLCGNEIWIERRDPPLDPALIAASQRIGISTGKEHYWRFFVRENAYVSKGKQR